MRENTSNVNSSNVVRLDISVIILTHDEEANIEACLASVAGWVREIHIVDSGSTDRTIELARNFTALIHHHPFENYSKQRNWALTELPLAGEWLLQLDADHRVTPELKRVLLERLAGPAADDLSGYLIARRTVFMGRWIRHGGHYPVYQAVLFRRGRGRSEERGYDQHYLVDGRTEMLPGDIIDEFSEPLARFVQRHKRWAAQEAEEVTRAAPVSGQVQANRYGTPIEHRRWMRERYYALPPILRAFAYFFWRYFLKRGFLDGFPGLVFHTVQGLWFRLLVDVNVLRSRPAHL